MDYISQLNLEEVPSVALNNGAGNDLESFMDSTFFDFDQFQSDSSIKVSVPGPNVNELSSQIPSELPENLTQFYNSTSFTQQNPVTKTIVKEETEEVLSLAKTQETTKLSIETHDEVEQDKKKRNTLASARFRVKKKLKEQEMERNVKLLSDRVATFNERINQLELENACLKSLILEKNEKKSNDLLRSIQREVVVLI
ncbi:unnamed protein product [Cyberlindnera jadinii]|uniref:BZIP domain-containing protein n=1 Tax=Cyberlindnera jadinii (strain ATCC 18201 / CBS 1600 / BCRC 20928 / JCM 3617 / NBRC 0987 / NRRL Y-1542) TaxID=983966 RepID=A0A0H5C697_CYBJN|nr:unnamed protein product [Cyberlindnera jadinii]